MYRLYRLGAWADKEYRIERGWKFSSDMESHEISCRIHASSYGDKIVLTGESAGRQIWWFDASVNDKSAEENFSFNPSKNPNSSDQLLRKILKDSHKVEPTTLNQDVHGVAGLAAHKALSFYATLQCDDGHWAGDYGGL